MEFIEKKKERHFTPMKSGASAAERCTAWVAFTGGFGTDDGA
jgi:hypothetical protein